MGRHYVWNTPKEAMIIRLQPRGPVQLDGYLWTYPGGGPIAGQADGPDPTEISFRLSAADVRYLLAPLADGTIPKLCVECVFLKAPELPSETKWGYRIQIAQPSGPATGQFNNGSKLTFDAKSFHRSGMRPFEPGEDFAFYRIVMELRET